MPNSGCGDDVEERQELHARAVAAHAAISRIDELSEQWPGHLPLIDALRLQYEHRATHLATMSVILCAAREFTLASVDGETEKSAVRPRCCRKRRRKSHEYLFPQRRHICLGQKARARGR
jgi:hypothetical protein